MAVTSPLAGTTRDRQYSDISWNEVTFTLVDTAGINPLAKDELEHNLHKQVDIAIEEADLILLVADGRLNRLSVDQSIIQKLRRTKKPMVLALNKLDSSKAWEEKLAEFAALGIKNVFPISSINGRGIGDMLDFVAKQVAKTSEEEAVLEENQNGIAVGIIGKPNVGKSSIFNAIVKEERVVVSPVPGTTRTAIDSQLEIEGQPYTFIDTAGLKKKTYRQAQADTYGGFQTFKTIRRSDVCFLVIDSIEEITKQDQRVAQEIFSLEKGIIILANKIDLFRGDKEKLRDYVSMHFPFLWMCPMFLVSGKNGEGLEEALAAIKPIFESRNKQVDNQALSEFLSKKIKHNPPKLLRDQKKPKVFSLHQVNANPPTFELLVNHPAAISQQFRKYIENSIIKDLDFWGTPIILKLKGKDKT